MGSVLRLVAPVLVYCDWLGQQIGALTSSTVLLHVKLRRSDPAIQFASRWGTGYCETKQKKNTKALAGCVIIFQKRHWHEKKLHKKKQKKRGHFAHICNEIKTCNQNTCYHHLSNVCENSFCMFHSNWVISDYHSFVWAVC